jgi:hypothetical protein
MSFRTCQVAISSLVAQPAAVVRTAINATALPPSLSIRVRLLGERGRGFRKRRQEAADHTGEDGSILRKNPKSLGARR